MSTSFSYKYDAKGANMKPFLFIIAAAILIVCFPAILEFLGLVVYGLMNVCFLFIFGYMAFSILRDITLSLMGREKNNEPTWSF
jgi:fatty acid desaturase